MSERLPHVAEATFDPATRTYSLVLSNGEREAVRLQCRPYEPFQRRVGEWMHPMFGSYICMDVVERRDRFTEEALELAQACGATREELHALVDYVMDRPVGEVGQEVGGVMVTLAALCGARVIDMHELGEIELERIWSPEVMEKIRTKQRGKPDFGPLPGPTPVNGTGDDI